MNGATAQGGGGSVFQVQVTVQDKRDMYDRFAAQLVGGRLFVQHDSPPELGSDVLIDFVLPSGQAISRIKGRVGHAKRGAVKGDPTAGMEVRLTGADPLAKQIIAHAKAQGIESQHHHAAPDAQRVDDLGATTAAASGPIIGIDLGTTNSCAAIVEEGKPRIITTPDGYETMPSVLFVTPQKKLLVGRKAIDWMTRFPDRAIYGSKRFIGRPFTSSEVHTFGHFFRYGLAPGKAGRVAAKVADVVVPLEAAAAYLLASIRNMAQAQLGEPVRRAVVTVPAYYGERQRQSVAEAARMAGLQLERLINEPTAGAVAYGFGKGLQRTILVYDLGGGTFDASVMRIDGDRMEVLATDGDPFLGGSDFDDRLTEYLATRVERDHKVSIRDNPVAMNRLRLATEMAKCQLSDAMKIKVQLPFLAESDDGQLNVELEVERSLLDTLTTDLVQRTLLIVQRALDAAQLPASALDDVVMIGGQSRSPLVRQLLQERFGKPPARNVHPDHAVALGAALVGAAAHRQAPVMLTDVLPATIRTASGNGGTRVLLNRGVPLPAETEFTVETTTGEEGAEYRVELLRGEEAAPEKNETIGMVRMGSSLAMAISKQDAKVRLRVDEQGLLDVSIHNPMTNQRSRLEVELDLEASTDEMIQVDAAEMAAV